MTSLVRAEQLVVLTNSVRAKKLVPGQLGACIKLALIRPAWYVHESWLSYDQLGTCKTAGPLGQLGACIKLAVIRPAGTCEKAGYDQLGTCKTAGRLDQLGTCIKAGPGPTRSVHKVGSYQTSSVRAKKLVVLRPVRYVQNSWSSWPTRYVQKLVQGQLGAGIKLALIRPAWYVHESWLSYDQLDTCKTAGLLDQLGTCKKVGPGPTRCVHKVGCYKTSSVRARKLVILWPAWYVQNSWSFWPTRCVQKSWFRANSVRA